MKLCIRWDSPKTDPCATHLHLEAVFGKLACHLNHGCVVDEDVQLAFLTQELVNRVADAFQLGKVNRYQIHIIIACSFADALQSVAGLV